MSMLLEEYQRRALDVEQRPKSVIKNVVEEDLYWALGLLLEASEVAEIFQKDMKDGLVPDRDRIKDELGDVLWFLNKIASLWDITLDQVARANLEKLTERQRLGV